MSIESKQQNVLAEGGDGEPIPASYAFNYHMQTSAGGALNESQIKSTATRIMVGESGANEKGIAWKGWTKTEWVDNGRGYAGHLGTWNCLYTDGHVKSLLPTKTALPINQWGSHSDNTAADGPDCNPGAPDYSDFNINCEVSSPNLVTAMNGVQQKYK